MGGRERRVRFSSWSWSTGSLDTLREVGLEEGEEEEAADMA